MFNDNKLKDVASAVSKVMEASMKEELKGNQHKIDANKNNKVDAHDFKLLRAGKKVAKEEAEQVEEVNESKIETRKIMTKSGKHIGTIRKMNRKTVFGHAYKVIYHPEHHLHGANYGEWHYTAEDGEKAIHSLHKSNVAHAKKQMAKAQERMKSLEEQLQAKQSEETEQVEEGIEDKLEAARAKAKAAGKKMKGPAKAEKSNVTKVAGKAYGGSAQKDEPEEDEDDTPKKATKKGVFKRRYNTKMYKEEFSGLLDSYINGGLKGIMEDLEVVEVETDAQIINEEVDNETFTKEVEAQKAKAEGKGKKADVAAASVQAVKNEEVESVEERTLTEPEMKKREDVVKGMKKNLAGFKERYGSRGKEVLYATATRIAKGEK